MVDLMYVDSGRKAKPCKGVRLSDNEPCGNTTERADRWCGKCKGVPTKQASSKQSKATLAALEGQAFEDVLADWRYPMVNVEWQQKVLDRVKATELEREDFDRHVNDPLMQLIPTANVGVRMDHKGLLGMLEEGRYVNQLESGRCGDGGFLAPNLRLRVEQELFGYDKTAPPQARPVYGHLFASPVDSLHWRGDSHRGELNRYGNILVEFQPEVRERSTFTLGDSIDDSGWGDVLDNGGRTKRLTEEKQAQNRRDEKRGQPPTFSQDPLPQRCPSPVTEPGYESFGTNRVYYNAEDDPTGIKPFDKGTSGRGYSNGSRPKPYFEAQVHGGVAVSDIAHVHFQRVMSDTIPAPLKTALQDAGIPWTLWNKQGERVDGSG